MNLCDVGWVWEGQGIDPGVHPSIFGIGDGAKFFGLRKCHFLYHPITELALEKLSHLDEVVCDISKWLFRNVGEGGGSEGYCERGPEFITAEAEKLSRLSVQFPNVTGAINDDTVTGLKEQGYSPEDYGRVYAAMRRHNPNLKHWWLLFPRELNEESWQGFEPFVDAITFWQWKYDIDLDAAVDRCAELFPGTPVYLGCYLRDYVAKAPMPIDILQDRFERIVRYLEEGRIAGYAILGTVLIEGHLEQAEWIRDFIARHS